MRPDEQRYLKYNELTAAGFTHKDALAEVRAMQATPSGVRALPPVVSSAGAGEDRTSGVRGDGSPAPAILNLPVVAGLREYGYRGYLAQEAKYGKKKVDEWRRLGGRKPNRTVAEIEAGIVPDRVRPQGGSGR